VCSSDLGMDFLSQWMEVKWGSSVGYSSMAYLLARIWLNFVFHSEEEFFFSVKGCMVYGHVIHVHKTLTPPL